MQSAIPHLSHTNTDRTSHSVAVPTPTDVTWHHAHEAVLYRRAHEPHRSKVAGFDLDSTLLRWLTSPGYFPSTLEDYALWSEKLPPLMRELHASGHKLVIFGNAATIQGAFTGKNAAKTKQLVDWLGISQARIEGRALCLSLL